jgi:hypothetical protein
MEDRRFTEVDLRRMLEKAKSAGCRRRAMGYRDAARSASVGSDRGAADV